MQTTYIGMGGNLASWAGEPEATLTAAALRLQSLGKVVRRSSLYLTEPVGFVDQPHFLNAVLALDTTLTPHELLGNLLAIEKEFGRDRTQSFANGPRPLDLDILLFGEWVLSTSELIVPHPRLSERAFVLLPLAEIAPGLIVPTKRKIVAELLSNQFSSSNPLTAIPFPSQSWPHFQ